MVPSSYRPKVPFLMSPLEMLGDALGVLMVLLLIRKSVWAWPVGLIDSALFVSIYFSAKLYSDVILQFIYCGIFAYGWWHWWRGTGDRRQPLPITRMSGRAVAGWTVLGAAATAAWGEFMHRHTDAALPHWDAFILVFSLIAQWLQARKRLENWIAWVVIDGVASGVYWAKSLRGTSALYLLYLAMGVVGFVAWKRSLVGRAPAGAAQP